MEPPVILLAQDVELTLELEKSFFAGTDVELLVARSGAEAIVLAREHKPDMIIMDHAISGKTGHRYCHLMKSDPELCLLPTVLVTLNEERLLAQCREAECNAIICKPLRRDAFLSVANDYVRLQEQRAPRVEVNFSVEYSYGGEQISASRGLNLSNGGVYIETPYLLPAATPLQLRFTLPCVARDIVTRARVAWVNSPDQPVKTALPPGMGVQFVGLSLEDMWAVREFLLNALGESRDLTAVA